MMHLILAAAIVAIVNAGAAPFNLADGNQPAAYGCGCVHKGNLYYPNIKDGCRTFTQETQQLAATLVQCPAGLLFNKKTCVCDYARNVDCSCGSSPSVLASGVCAKTCEANGNVYRPVAGCKGFTQETALLKAAHHDCPPGQLFDTLSCVCNHKSDVQCDC